MTSEPYYFNVPKGWQQYSSFMYFSDSDKQNQEKAELEKGIVFYEDVLGITSPSGFFIDLSWYGVLDNKNLFGTVLIHGDWDHPDEKVQLATFNEAVNWVNKWIKKIKTIENELIHDITDFSSVEAVIDYIVRKKYACREDIVKDEK